MSKQKNKIVYKNRYINILDNNGMIEIENTHGGSVVLPITEKKELILMDIYRNTINGVSIEAPRGFMEIGETSLQAGQRELYEEIHCTCEKYISLGYLYPDTGLQKAKIDLFLGLNAKIQESYVQVGEGIKRIRIIPFKIAYDMARNGEISDSFTLAAIFRSSKYVLRTSGVK